MLPREESTTFCGTFCSSRNLTSYSVTPNSGSKTSIAVIGDVDVIGGISGYDPKNNVLWIEFGTGKSVSSSLLYLSLSSLSLFRFNLNNGTQSSIPNNLNMETMDYDPVSGLMVGVGLQVVSPTNYFRVFLTLDSANNKWNVVGMYLINNSQANSPKAKFLATLSFVLVKALWTLSAGTAFLNLQIFQTKAHQPICS